MSARLQVAPRGRFERGFAMVEVLVAVLLLTTGLLALATTMTGSNRLTTVAEKSEAAIHVAQRELERIRSLPSASYASIAMPSTFSGLSPATPASDPDAPDYSGVFNPSASPPTFQWSRGDPLTAETLVQSGSSTCTATMSSPCVPFRSAWSDAATRLSGSIYRFITWVGGGGCTGSPSATTCMKRVTVAVTVDGEGPRKPIYVSGFVRDRSAAGDPLSSATCTEGASNEPVPCAF